MFRRFPIRMGLEHWAKKPIDGLIFKERRPNVLANVADQSDLLRGFPVSIAFCFAGNPYLISMEDLVERGFLTEADLKSLEGQDPKRVDYGRLFSTKMPLLEKAYFNHHLEEEAFRTFVAENQFWLEDYALFMALKKNMIINRLSNGTMISNSKFRMPSTGLNSSTAN